MTKTVTMPDERSKGRGDYTLPDLSRDPEKLTQKYRDQFEFGIAESTVTLYAKSHSRRRYVDDRLQ